MELLKNASVKSLVARAVKAGNKRPTVAQLKTLAVAVGDRDSFMFLNRASVRDLTAVKNEIQAVVYGEKPKTLAADDATVFGQAGADKTLPTEEQKKIYTPKVSPKTTDEQKDMRARRKVQQEDKHPETSDRAAETPVVAEPLPVKIEPEFKKVLERGEAHLNDIEKETKTAGKKTAMEALDVNEPEVIACSAKDCVHHAGNQWCGLKTISVTTAHTCAMYAQADAKTADAISASAGRIRRGEHVEAVLKDLVVKMAIINPGDTTMIPNAQTGPQQVTFEAGGTNAQGQDQVVGKDASGNTIVTLPKGTDPAAITDTNEPPKV